MAMMKPVVIQSNSAELAKYHIVLRGPSKSNEINHLLVPSGHFSSRYSKIIVSRRNVKNFRKKIAR